MPSFFGGRMIQWLCLAVVSCFNPSPFFAIPWGPCFSIQRHRDQSLAAPRFYDETPTHDWKVKQPKNIDLVFFGPYVEISGCVWFFLLLLVVCFFLVGCVVGKRKEINEKTQPKLVNNIPFGVNKGLVTWSWILTRTSQESFDLKHAWNLTGNIWKKYVYHGLS